MLLSSRRSMDRIPAAKYSGAEPSRLHRTEYFLASNVLSYLAVRRPQGIVKIPL